MRTKDIFSIFVFVLLIFVIRQLLVVKYEWDTYSSYLSRPTDVMNTAKNSFMIHKTGKNTTTVAFDNLQPTTAVHSSSTSSDNNINLLTAANPIFCPNRTYCCGRWDVNADNWWIHHPHWEIVSEDDTSFCFSSLKDANRTIFLKRLHQLQWSIDIDENKDFTPPEDYEYSVNCSNVCATDVSWAGLGAYLQYFYDTFWYAQLHNRPYQNMRRKPWMYATKNNESLGYCDDHDHTCVYLPISPCPRTGNKTVDPHIDMPKLEDDIVEFSKYLWLQEYLVRPKQTIRHLVYEMGKPYRERLSGCTALHVRRGDAGVPRRPFRRFAAVVEYLDKLPDTLRHRNKTVLLLTDDHTTIEEIDEYYNCSSAPFTFVYIDKKRRSGLKGGRFDYHIPDDADGFEELLNILLEMDLIQHCNAFVHGDSGYSLMLWDKMILKGRTELDRFYLKTTVFKKQARKHGSREKHEEALFAMVTNQYKRGDKHGFRGCPSKTAKRRR